MANFYRFIASRWQERRKNISERNDHILELVELGNKIFISYESFLNSPPGVVGSSAFISDFRYDNHESVNLYGLPVGNDRHLHFNIITVLKTMHDQHDYFGVKVEIFKESDDFFVSLGNADCVVFEFTNLRVEEYLSKISSVIRHFVSQMNQDRMII